MPADGSGSAHEPVGVLLEQLAAAWIEEAEQLRRRYGRDDLARLCEAHAEELAQTVSVDLDEVVTLAEAIRHSGYSSAHLRQLLKSGVLTNAGRRGAPRFVRRELPRKGSIQRWAATLPEPEFDVDAAVRKVVGELRCAPTRET